MTKAVTKVKQSRLLEEKKFIARMREQFPQLFNDPEMQALAAIIAKELNEELVSLSPLQQLSTVATVATLMFQMGTAASKATSIIEKRGMIRIFIETYESQ